MSLAGKRRAVVLFTGNPRVEEQRKALPRGFLSVLHRDLARSVRAVRGVALILAADSREGFRLSTPGAESLLTYRDISEKVQASIDFAAVLGHSSVILLAGDVAGVASSDLEDAFDLLERSADCVIAPAGDGGFSLLGLHVETQIDWNAIPWFTERAAAGLRDVVDRSGLTRVELRRLDDIDDRASALGVVAKPLTRLRSLLLGLLAFHLPSIPSWTRPDGRILITSTRLRAPPFQSV